MGRPAAGPKSGTGKVTYPNRSTYEGQPGNPRECRSGGGDVKCPEAVPEGPEWFKQLPSEGVSSGVVSSGFLVPSQEGLFNPRLWLGPLGLLEPPRDGETVKSKQQRT